MTTKTPTATCRRCRATLRSARSVAAGIGPTCAKLERREQAIKAAGFKPAQVAKAQELIEQGGIVAIRGHRVFAVVASNGVDRYLTARTGQCNCPAGLKGRRCYHVAAAILAA